MGTRTAEVGRLIKLAAKAIELTQEDKRSPEQIAALLNFLQGYKEDRKVELPKEEKKEKKQEIEMMYIPDHPFNSFSKEREAIHDFLEDRKIVDVHCKISKKLLKTINKGFSLGFKLHFLPRIRLEGKDNSINWKVRPNPDFYGFIEMGLMIERRPDWLKGELVLVDGRAKPLVNTENYNNDFLPLPDFKLTKSRNRFGMCRDAIQKNMFPIVATKLKVNHLWQVRFPRFIEFCYLVNCFYPHWIAGDTMEWFEDTYGEQCNLLNGGKISDGVIHTENVVEIHMTAFRPLVVLGFLVDEECLFIEA